MNKIFALAMLKQTWAERLVVLLNLFILIYGLS